jgi:hypothetical protein
MATSDGWIRGMLPTDTLAAISVIVDNGVLLQ